MKQILILAFTICTGSMLMAQQDAMFTHYMYNTQAVNPAYAGTRGALTLTGLHRSQWIGFEGAPTTQTITGHMPLWGDRLGIGLSVWNDNIGPINQTGLAIDYAYKIRVSKRGKLSLGLKTGFSLLNVGLSQVRLDTEGDQAFAGDFQSQLLPNFGFGMYYYEPRWYVGLSSPKLLQNDFASGFTDRAAEELHVFLIAGTVFDVGKLVKMKPTTFVKVTPGAPIEADLTFMFGYMDRLWAGPMVRTGDAVGLLLNYQFTEQFTAGYSFDWSFANTTSKFNAGSMEVMLRYDFIFTKQPKIKSPRYF